MSEQQSSYRQIFKATSIFGGVQVFNILIGIVKTKVVAVLLGPFGVGLISLFNSTIQLLIQFSGLGIDQSGVRDVAEAYGTNNNGIIASTLKTVRRLVWVTGLLGVVITIALSPWLSQWTFDSADYTWSFILLSSILLFTQLGNGQSMLLRGTRQIKKLAKASLLGAIFGLCVSVPLYYFFGVDGIVPSLILSSAFVAVVFWWFAKKIKVDHCDQTISQTISRSTSMVKFGVMMTLSALLGSVISYAVRIYISHEGGMDQVGLFSAAFMIIDTYLGMVFAAMATDFYPRLAAINKDTKKVNEVTNHQSFIALLIVAPLIMIFIAMAPVVVKILYSDKFLPIVFMMQIAVVGILFRTGSWSMSFIMLAKARTKLFFIKEAIAGLFMLTVYLVGYSLFGLLGVGCAFVVAALFHLIECYFFTQRCSPFRFTKSYVITLIFEFALAACMIMATLWLDGFLQMMVCAVGIIIASALSFRKLNDVMDIKGLIKQKLNK